MVEALECLSNSRRKSLWSERLHVSEKSIQFLVYLLLTWSSLQWSCTFIQCYRHCVSESVFKLSVWGFFVLFFDHFFLSLTTKQTGSNNPDYLHVIFACFVFLPVCLSVSACLLLLVCLCLSVSIQFFNFSLSFFLRNVCMKMYYCECLCNSFCAFIMLCLSVCPSFCVCVDDLLMSHRSLVNNSCLLYLLALI